MLRCVLIAVAALAAVPALSAHTDPPLIPTAVCQARLEESALVVQATMTIARPERRDASVRLLPNAFPLVGSPPRAEGVRVVMRAGACWLSVRPGSPRRAELALGFRAPLFRGRDWLARLRRFSPAIARDRALPAAWTQRVAQDPTLRVCVLPVLPATAMTVDLPGECYEIESSPQTPVERTQGGWRLYAPPCQRVFLLWRATPPPKAAELAFRIDADASVTVARRSLVADTQVTADVLQGELRGLTIVLPAGAQLRSIEGKAIERWELRRGKVAVVLRAPGTRRVELAVGTEMLAGADGAFAWQPVEVEGAQHQGGRAYFRARPGLLLQAVDRRGFERVSDGYAPDAAAGRQTLVLAYPRLPASIRLAVEEIEARVTANVAVLAQIERGTVTQRAQIDYAIRDVGLRRFRVRVGEDADVLEVACAGLLDYEVADGVLAVRLREAVRDKAQLQIVVQRPCGGDTMRHGVPRTRGDGVALPRLTALDVAGQTWLMGVAAGTDVELRHRQAVQADQIDVRLLPEWVRKLGPKLAYRYYDRPGSLVTVETEAIQPEFDAQASETARLNDEGWSRQVAWSCRIVRGEVFAWRVRLPEGVVPLAADCMVPAKVPVRSQRDAPAVSVLKDWEFDQPSRVLRLALARGVTGGVHVWGRFLQRTPDPLRETALEAIVLEGARRHTGALTVQTRRPLSLRAAAAAGLDPRPGAEGQLAFALDDPAWTLRLEATPIEPVIAVETVTVLGMRPGQVAAETLLTLSIQKARVNELRLRLPEGAVNSVVRGQDIKSSQLVGRDWTLRLARKVQGGYQLSVSYDHVIPAEGGTCRCATLEVLDAKGEGVARQEGVLLVARDSARIEVTVEQAEGLFEMDPADAPRRGPATAGRAIIDAYRYTGAGSLTARIDVLSRADVVEAKALGVNVFTLIKQDGQRVTQLIYDLQSGGRRQFLRIELPEGAMLLGAYVDGLPVPASTGLRGAILVPLLRGAAAARAGEMLEVSLFYAQQDAPLGSGRTVALRSPKVDVPTKTLSWAVFLPAGYRAQDTDGNMKLMLQPPGHRWWAVFGGMFADEAVLAGAVLEWLLYALSVVWLVIRVYGWLLGLGLFLFLFGLLVYRKRGELLEAWRRLARARAKRREATDRPRWRRVLVPALGISSGSLVGCLIVVAALAVLAGMLLPAMSRAREESRRVRARNNLNQIAKGMATYLNEHGDNRFYPGSGRTLYDSGVIPDPGVFVDPETGRPFVYLYEGRYLRDDFPPDKPMGYMEGTEVVHVLFFDSHVESFPYGSDKLAALIPDRRLRKPSFAVATGPSGRPQAWRLGGAEDESLTTIDGGIRESARGEVSKSMSDLREGDRKVQKFAEAFDEEIEGLKGKKLDFAQRQMLDRLETRRSARYKGADLDLPPDAGRSRGDTVHRNGGEDLAKDVERPHRPGTGVITYANRRPPAKEPEKGTMTPEPAPAPVQPTDPTATPPGTKPTPPGVAMPGEQGEQKKKPGDGWDARPGGRGGAVAGEGTRGGPPEYGGRIVRYSAVHGGRQKGALPIALELPEEDALPYIFYHPAAGRGQGEIELVCRPMGASRPAKGILIVGILALVGLVVAGVRGSHKRGKRG